MALTMWDSAGLVPSSFLFNIYMNICLTSISMLGEIIHYHGVRYHRNSDDPQLYISILGEISDAVDVLS